MNQSSSNENENDDQFIKVSVDAMQHVFGFVPHHFQRKVTPHLIKMKNNHCSPVLLAHVTNRRKSSIYHTFGIATGGILLLNQSTLYLLSDKISKNKLMSSKYDGAHSMQLYSVKTRN